MKTIVKRTKNILFQDIFLKFFQLFFIFLLIFYSSFVFLWAFINFLKSWFLLHWIFFLFLAIFRKRVMVIGELSFGRCGKFFGILEIMVFVKILIISFSQRCSQIFLTFINFLQFFFQFLQKKFQNFLNFSQLNFLIFFWIFYQVLGKFKDFLTP